MAASGFQRVLESPVATYEEGLQFFRGEGMINETLRRLAQDHDRHGIEYCVVGAVALNQHGYHRFTESIDVLLSPEGLETFRRELIGHGYRPAFQGASRRFRETVRNVPIEVLVAGEYPGDGKPKSVRFEVSGAHVEVIDGIRTVSLTKLIELKLASGMTAPGRLKDLADFQELIRVRDLDAGTAAHLDPLVRDRYLELLAGVDEARRQ
ncbi:MAG TPA: hypothetical protein VKT77_15015, partial [Chthonomonadaceae bacterium]|nr:hypothetical protein [Chthonomonadaceae bacterium]